MAENSKIEWCHHTFNPWIGCQKVGPGCDHCYAEAWDARGLQQREGRWGAHATRTRTSAGNWSKPKAWNKAAAGLAERPRVFCASLADVMDNHASITDQMRRDQGALIEETPNLDWMLLTKRIGNAPKFLPIMFPRGLPANVWLGCTVVNQAEADRDIPKLLATPAAVRFVSAEPLLGPLDLCHLRQYNPRGEPWINALRGTVTRGQYLARSPSECSFATSTQIIPPEIPRLDLVIVGGESGPGARPMHPDWARSLRDQCVAAGVPFFFKQWGEWGQAAARPSGTAGKYAIASAAPHSDFWPQRVVETDHYPRQINLFGGARVLERVGKKAAGRLLDGREWNQMPGAHDG